MKAVIQDRYGTTDVIAVGDIPAPAEDEVLVQIRVVSLNGSDRENLAGRPYYARMAGLRRPRDPVPGSDTAGPPIRWATGKQVKVLAVPQSPSNLETVTALITDDSAAITVDRTYPPAETPEAFRRLVSGDNRGGIIIEVS